MSGVLCAHQTSRGYGCMNTAKDGLFCPSHDPRNTCVGVTRSGKRCGRMKSFGTDHCSVHQGTPKPPWTWSG